MIYVETFFSKRKGRLVDARIVPRGGYAEEKGYYDGYTEEFDGLLLTVKGFDNIKAALDLADGIRAANR